MATNVSMTIGGAVSRSEWEEVVQLLREGYGADPTISFFMSEGQVSHLDVDRAAVSVLAEEYARWVADGYPHPAVEVRVGFGDLDRLVGTPLKFADDRGHPSDFIKVRKELRRFGMPYLLEWDGDDNVFSGALWWSPSERVGGSLCTEDGEQLRWFLTTPSAGARTTAVTAVQLRDAFDQVRARGTPAEDVPQAATDLLFPTRPEIPPLSVRE